jgi:transposase
LDARAQQRVIVLTHLVAGELTLAEAAAYLGRSTRQVRRLVAGFRTHGPAAVVHGNRGRAPANATDEATRRRIVELARTTDAGFNPVHLAEAPAEDEAIETSARTVRRILGAAGVSLPRTRRPTRHRSRRDRMPRAGMLLQVDGGRHDWLEGRGPRLTLVAGIDDATARSAAGHSGSGKTPRAPSSCSARPSSATACPRPSPPTSTGSSSRTRTGPRRSPSSSPGDRA